MQRQQLVQGILPRLPVLQVQQCRQWAKMEW